MSGEAFGVVVVPAIPVVIAGATIYGIASVVKSLVEKEKANREAQRQRIEQEAGKYRLEAKKALEKELKEIEERKKQREKEKAEKEKQEAIKKQQLEEAAKRERIAQSISMTQLDGIKKNLNIRLLRLVNEIEHVKNKKLQQTLKNNAEVLQGFIMNSTKEDIDAKRKELDDFISKVERIKKYGYDPEEREKIVKKMIAEIETVIEDLPPSYSRFILNDITDIKQSIIEIKTKVAGNYTFYESILKGIKLRLREATDFAKRKWEEQEKQLDLIEKEMQELLVDIETVIASPLVYDKSRAITLKASINKLYAYNDFNYIRRELHRLTPEIKKAYADYIELKKLEGERQYIANSVQEILDEMGYEVSKLPYENYKKSEAPLYIELNIPGGEGVRLGFGIDKTLFAEVYHPKTGEMLSKENLRKQEKKWCSDIDKLKAKMEEKGMAFSLEWRKDIEDERIEQMEAENLKPEEEQQDEEYWRRISQNHGRMQK